VPFLRRFAWRKVRLTGQKNTEHACVIKLLKTKIVVYIH
jgi:hypothetical protein